MKKIVFLFVCFNLNFAPTFAQIFVKDNTFIYNKGTVVYSKGYLNLSGIDSKFYLRNEGQFLQGTVGTSANTGIGKLSVFQEGTVNNYAYNYWCSPVGNATAAVLNQPFGITMLNVPTTNIVSTASTASASYNGFCSPGALAIAPFWIFKYTTDTAYSGWLHSYSNTDIQAGQGFTMKGTIGSDGTGVGETVVNNPYNLLPAVPSAQRYDFRGKPNDGDIPVSVGLDKFTLSGNPYPSALDVNKFLLDAGNTDILAQAYYWEQDKTVNSHLLLAYQGGYGTYVPISLVSYGMYVPPFFLSYNIDGTPTANPPSGSGLVLERRYAPIGQGFMVKGKSTGVPASVTIKNTHREYYKESGTYSDFEKQSSGVSTHSNQDAGINTTPHIRINIIVDNTNTRQIALAFVPDATDGVDRGIDGLSPNPTLSKDGYFFINNERYVIEGINFDENKRVPLGVDATNNTTFKFSLSQVVNFDDAQQIYIYDDLDGSYHNLKQGDFEVTLPTGIYNNRFQITFKNAALSIPTSVKENVIVVQNNSNQLLTVLNPQMLDIKSVMLFDISGKLLFNRRNLESKASYEFSTSSYSTGVYLVKILSKDGQNKAQKIIIDAK